jgi:hypothetical protein
MRQPVFSHKKGSQTEFGPFFIRKSRGFAMGLIFFCGERGIRTLGTVTSTTVFETAPFDRSGISPGMGAKLISNSTFQKCFENHGNYIAFFQT